MSNPLVHAERSARQWGGTADDYLPLHQWFDATKGHVADQRHRMVLHNAFGILLAEQVFGPTLVNSAGRRVFTRDIGLQHVREDLGFVPSLAECLAELPVRPWMAGARRRSTRPITSAAGCSTRSCPACGCDGGVECCDPITFLIPQEPISMSDRFQRQAELVPQERLENLTVDVIGVGAIGRQLALQLASLGARRLRLFDPDHVEPTNVTTQGYSLVTDIGQPKVLACQKAIALIDSEVIVELITDRYRSRYGASPAVFCCVDTISAREAIWRSVGPNCRFWCDGRMLGEVIRILGVADGVGSDAYHETLFTQDQAQAGRCTARSTIYTAALAAGLMLHQLTRWLRGIPIQADSMVDLLAGEWTGM